MKKAVLTTEAEVSAVTEEVKVEKKTVIPLLSLDYGREDLNTMAKAVNEIIIILSNK